MGVAGRSLRPAEARSSRPAGPLLRALRKLLPEYHFSLLIFHFSFAVPEGTAAGRSLRPAEARSSLPNVRVLRRLLPDWSF